MTTNPTVVLLLTVLWGWAVGTGLLSLDWRAIAAAVRAQPLNAGGGYAIAGLALVATCPLWLLLTR